MKLLIPNPQSHEASRFFSAVHDYRNRRGADINDYLISGSCPIDGDQKNGLIIILHDDDHDPKENQRREQLVREFAMAAGMELRQFMEPPPEPGPVIRRPKVGEMVHYVVDYPDTMSSWGGHGCRPALVVERAKEGAACNLQIFLSAADRNNEYHDSTESDGRKIYKTDAFVADFAGRWFRYECMNAHESVFRTQGPPKWRSELWEEPCPHRPWNWHHIDECKER